MVALARPLTSTAAPVGHVLELRCPTPRARPDGWQARWEGRCNRLLSEVISAGGPFRVSLVCPRCHQRTTFEVTGG